MMEAAVEAMRSSIGEKRSDGKATPLVGVALRLPDGSVETAHRGELREGDHAEYTLLERKQPSTKLDDAVLFTTLEPCAPGARTHPKLSCSERIVLARIKKVWVGLEDPDPTVDRKGIKFLQEEGVQVEMFDSDLQDVIRSANEEFIGQALARKAVAKAGAELPSLSELEDAITPVALSDFSAEALERYRAEAKILDATDSPPFRARLLQQGLLKKEKDGFKPTGFGYLLFGKEPRNALPQAGLLATIHLGEKEDARDFDGPLVLIPEQVESWLRDKLPSAFDRSTMRRRPVEEFPFALLRESIVNALVHRDYSIGGAKCQLSVKGDAVTIRSPGAPVPPITLERMQSFSAPELSRNPILHFVFARMGLAEERGLGMKTLRSLPAKLGLPLPRYAFEDPYLSLTLFRSAEGAVQGLPQGVLASLNRDEQAGWAFLSSRAAVTQSEYAEHFGLDARKAQRHLAHFVKMGLLSRSGRGRATQYKLRR